MPPVTPEMNALPEVPEPGRPRRPRRRRLLRLAAILIGAGTLGLIALYLLRGSLLAPTLLRLAADRAEAEYGLELQIDGLGGSWLGDLVLTGVRAKRVRGTLPLERLEADRLRAEYSLWDLARGREGWLHSIGGELRHLAIDLSRRGPDAPEPRGDEQPFGMSADLPEIALRAAEIDLRLPGDRSLRLAELDVEAASTEGGQRVEVALARCTLEDPELGRRQAPLQATLLYRAGEIELESLALGELLRTEGARLDLRELDSGHAAWDARLQIFSGEIEVRGERQGRSIDTELRIADLDLARIPEWAPIDTDTWPAGRLELSGDLRIDPSDPLAGEASLSLALHGFALADRDFVRVEAEVDLSGGTLSVPRLEAVQDGNRIALSGGILPLDQAGSDGGILDLLARAEGRLEAEIRDLPALIGEGRATRAARTLPSHSIELAAGISGGSIEIEAARLSVPGGELVARSGRLDLAATSSIADAHLDLNLLADFEDLADLGRILETEPWSGSLRGAVRIVGPLSAPVGELDLGGSEVVVAGRPLGEVAVRVHLDGERAQVERFEARDPRGRLTLSGSYAFSDGRLEGASLEVETADLAQLAPAAFAGGRAQLSATLDGPLRAPSGPLTLEAADVELRGRRIDSLRLRGELAGLDLRLEELAATGPDGGLVASGELRRSEDGQQLDATLRTLVLKRDAQTLSLERPARIALTDGRVQAGPLELSGELGRATLALSLEGEEQNLSISLEDLDPMPVAAPFLPPGFAIAGIDGTLDARLGPELLRVAADLRVRELRPAEGSPSFSLRAAGDLAGGIARLEAIEIASPAHGSLRVRGSCPLDPLGEAPLSEGELDLEVQAETGELATWLDWLGSGLEGSGSARLDGQLAGSWSAVRGRLEVAGSDLRLAAESSEGVSEFGPAVAEVEIELLGEGIAARALLCGEEGEVRLEGTLGVPLDLAGIAAGEGQALLEGAIDLRTRLDLPDLAFAATATGAVRRLAGALDAELRIEGTLGEPELTGSVALSGGELRLAGSLPALAALDARLEMDGSSIRVEKLTGELGGAPFRIAGTADLSGEELAVNLSLQGENLLLHRRAGLKVRADADLSVSGPLSGLVARGGLALTDARFVRQVDFLGSALGGGGSGPRGPGRGLDLSFAEEGPLAAMELDLALTAKRPFVLKNNVMSGGLRPDLRLLGTGQVPVLRGPVYLEPTRISLPGGRLLVESGTVVFLEEDPFTPQLELAARSRMRGYDISVRISGPYDRLEIAASSVPPLPGEELLELLATGRLSAEGSADRGQRAAEALAIFLARDFLGRWFASESTEAGEGLMDRIEVQSGRDVTESGATTTWVGFRTQGSATGAGRTQVLTGELDEYDKINFGWRFVFRFE